MCSACHILNKSEFLATVLFNSPGKMSGRDPAWKLSIIVTAEFGIRTWQCN